MADRTEVAFTLLLGGTCFTPDALKQLAEQVVGKPVLLRTAGSAGEVVGQVKAASVEDSGVACVADVDEDIAGMAGGYGAHLTGEAHVEGKGRTFHEVKRVVGVDAIPPNLLPPDARTRGNATSGETAPAWKCGDCGETDIRKRYGGPADHHNEPDSPCDACIMRAFAEGG